MRPGISVRRRFLFYLLVFAAVMFIVTVFALFVTGGVSPSSETAFLIQNEWLHLASDVERQFGQISAQAVRMSRALSLNIEAYLREEGMSVSELSGRPEAIEELLAGEAALLLLSLGRARCGGVFVVLDATANPKIAGARYSKAGMLIRGTEQSFLDQNSEKLYLRGPARIAMRNGFTLQSKWALEFDVRDSPFWEYPLRAHADNPRAALSRLFYWHFTDRFPGSKTSAVCSLPLIDSKGESFGVCGFEIGERAFARIGVLDVRDKARMIGALSLGDSRTIRTAGALFTGNAAVYGALRGVSALERGGRARELEIFEGGGSFVGMTGAISLYTDDSPFAPGGFVVTAAIPKEDYDWDINASRLRLGLISGLMLCLGFAAAMFLSERYERPFKIAVEAVRAGETDVRSNIREIDALIESIRSLHPSDENIFADFIVRLGRLTPAERRIFDCYAEGHGTDEILKRMFISVNTLKRHNNHIYAKLNVSGRDEMKLYIELMRRTGKLTKISDPKLGAPPQTPPENQFPGPLL
ncbi:MAG: helix-turn-helix transcriptional regulator [Synergistaceae bacterium]|nr:helix-turn-helix transcriptional regulator [Synergistaceae bacterium]